MQTTSPILLYRSAISGHAHRAELLLSLLDLVVSQVELAGKKSMDFFGWQGVRTPHGEPCKDEQRCQTEKDTIYSRQFSLTDY